MTLQEFVYQEREVRQGIHYHDGVWWRRTAFQCCQPVYALQEIEPLTAAPRLWKTLVRYSHVVPHTHFTGRTRTRLVLQGERLRNYDIGDLERRRRQAISKAHRSGLVAQRITCLDDHWRDLREIFISTAARTGYGLRPEYYVEKEAKWREGQRREFSLRGRDWFGVFSGKKLIAYIYSCLVEETAVMLVTKCHADYLRSDPNDLLWFFHNSYYRDQPGCRRLDAGWSIAEPPSIDWRKTKLGFERVEIPVFERTRPVAAQGMALVFGVMRPVLAWMQRKEAKNRSGTPQGALESPATAANGERDGDD